MAQTRHRRQKFPRKIIAFLVNYPSLPPLSLSHTHTPVAHVQDSDEITTTITAFKGWMCPN